MTEEVAQYGIFDPPPPQDEKPFDENSPAAYWASEEAKHALDELFNATLAFRASKDYFALLQFVKRFKYYSPYNAFLIRLQRPGAQFVAPPSRWEKKYGRFIKPNANPIVILQPMGPVMFVFDAIDTYPGPDPVPLPPGIDKPIDIKYGKIGKKLPKTINNAMRDGVGIVFQQSGSQLSGSIRRLTEGRPKPLQFMAGWDDRGKPTYIDVEQKYEITLNAGMSDEAQYATIVHELAHLYCGHIGTPNRKWWPDRNGLSQTVAEFEAESISYLVCQRANIKSDSETYLAGYIQGYSRVPQISLECVMKTAGLIESMGRGVLKMRKKEG